MHRTLLRATGICRGVAIVFLLIDALGKVARVDKVIEGTRKLGYDDGVLVPLGIVLAACTVIYAIPRTQVLGAVLLTGYLGGAVATHVRAADGWFGAMFPFLVATFVWGDVWVRNERLRSVIPIDSTG